MYASRGFSKMIIKYIMVKICPRNSYGASTGRPPIHVRRAALAVITQNSSWFMG